MYEHHPMPAPERRRMSTGAKVAIILAIVIVTPIVLLVGAVVAIGVMSTNGTIPSAVVLSGAEVPANQRRKLVEYGVVGEDEKIEFFYSDAFFYVMENGQALTDTRLVAYESSDDEFFIYDATFDEITAIDVLSWGTFVDPTVVEVSTSGDEDVIYLSLSTGEQGDRKFLRLLERRTNLKMTEP
jgi:hypothetical protein